VRLFIDLFFIAREKRWFFIRREGIQKKWEEMRMRKLTVGLAAAVLVAASMSSAANAAEEVQIPFGAFWVQTGVFKSFGVNSKAVYESFVEELHSNGGVKLKDGRIGKISTKFYDSGCNAEQALAVIRKMASVDKRLLAVGPTCSGALEPVFGILQKKLDDASDTGLQFMVFSDTSAKPGLGKISPWGFRASPNESAMYLDVMKHLKGTGIKTVAFGFEDNFPHSTATYKVMRKHALASGLKVAADLGWHYDDTEFSVQARKIKAAKADAMIISAHPFTTCGFMREAKRQRIKQKILIGLTSSSSIETLQGCAKEVESMIIPTAFAPVNDEARRIAGLVSKKGGFMDIHSAAVWEVMTVLIEALEATDIKLKPDTLADDRRKIRDYVANVGDWKGLLGRVLSKNKGSSAHDGDVNKPWLLAQAKGAQWGIYWRPKALGGEGPLEGVN
jgi:branched-chain amino acid transport system substrate-binding protein